MARNLAFGVGGESISGALNFLTFIIIARALGPAKFGIFSYILAFVGVFQLLADFGVTNILVREIARSRSQVAEIMGSMRPLAWITSLAVVGIIAAIGWPLSPTRDVYFATLLLGLSVLATFHSFSFAAVCRAFEEMQFNAIGNVAHKILQIGLVYSALKANTGVIGVGAAMLTANLCQWMFFAVVVRMRYAPKIRWRYDRMYWRYLFTEAAPIGVAMVLRRANQNVGTLVLTMLSTTTAVGLFSAAYKIIQMIDMIPFTLSLPLFPPMARLAQESREGLFELLTRALRMFMVLAAPIVVWVWTMAPWLVRMMFGASYTQAVPTVRVLVLAVLFLFVTALYGYLFSALNRQRFYTLTSACCVATNLILDLVLVRPFGEFGAALAALVSEAVFCGVGAWLLYTLGFRISILRFAGRPILLAALVAPMLLWTMQSKQWIAAGGSALFGLLYLTLVLITGTVDRRERLFILSLIARRGQRPQPA